MTLSNEAVEAAARAICEERCWPGAWIKANELETAAWMRDATAALTAVLPIIRAQVLEEAAKVADSHRCKPDSPVRRGATNTARLIGEEIRTLKENHP